MEARPANAEEAKSLLRGDGDWRLKGRFLHARGSDMTAQFPGRGTACLDVTPRTLPWTAKSLCLSCKYIGPCPICGGKDRFGINPHKQGKNGKPGLFLCRQCGEGGDAIDLERFLSGTKFKDAVKDLSGPATVEEDPREAARRARWWAFCRATIEETVCGLWPILGSPAEVFLRDERCIDTGLPAIRRALETVAAVGWHPSVYFGQKDPDEPFHELHGRRLGCIVGIMTDPATGERLGPISRTYLLDGKKIGKAKTLKRAEIEKLGVVKVSLDSDIRRLAVATGLETALAFLEMGGVPVWSTGSDNTMRWLPVIDGVEQFLIGADNDAGRPGERGASERAGRELRARWLGAGRKAEFYMPPNFQTDFNDVLMQRKGHTR
jgi:Toprim domain/Zinc-binding domain of primase-helicase